MGRLLETREHMLLLLIALPVTLGLACKTPGAAAPGSATENSTAQPETQVAEPEPEAGQGQVAADAGACDTRAPYLLGVLPRPTTCLGNDFIARLMWQVFIALQWTADTAAGRGVAKDPDNPDALGTGGDTLVWSTWKQDWELSVGPAGRSSPWDSYEVSPLPCDFFEEAPRNRVRVTARSWPGIFEANGRTVLDKINLVMDDHDSQPGHSFVFTGPVITSDRTYVRYETRFNQALYDCARDGSGAGCVAEPLSLPAFTGTQDGALAIKAAWRPLSDDGEKSAYYWREVLVPYYEQSPQGKRVTVCRPEPHVLLGMHVIYKNGFVDTGPNQWIWATFEHEDLAPSCADVQAGWKTNGYSYIPEELARAPLPPPSQRTPVELCRLKDVPPVTAAANQDYARFLPAPWSKYRVAAMQWLMGGSPAPLKGVANVILEAYAQEDSCMGCHNQQAVAGDFVWTLVLDQGEDLPLGDGSRIANPAQLWR